MSDETIAAEPHAPTFLEELQAHARAAVEAGAQAKPVAETTVATAPKADLFPLDLGGREAMAPPPSAGDEALAIHEGYARAQSSLARLQLFLQGELNALPASAMDRHSKGLRSHLHSLLVRTTNTIGLLGGG